MNDWSHCWIELKEVVAMWLSGHEILRSLLSRKS
jgi:hypothetical protein